MDFLEHRRISETEEFENHCSIASKLNFLKTFIETFIFAKDSRFHVVAGPTGGSPYESCTYLI